MSNHQYALYKQVDVANGREYWCAAIILGNFVVEEINMPWLNNKEETEKMAQKTVERLDRVLFNKESRDEAVRAAIYGD